MAGWTEEIKEKVRGVAYLKMPGVTKGAWIVTTAPCVLCQKKSGNAAWHPATLAYKCFICGTFNVYEILKDEFPPDFFKSSEVQALQSPQAKAIDVYRRNTKKHWRLNDAVVRHFGVQWSPDMGRHGALVINDQNGRPARRLQHWNTAGTKPGWKNVEGVGRVCIFGGGKPPGPGPVVFCEGEWDLFACWEAFGVQSVYVAGGAGAIKPTDDTSVLFAWLNSTHQVIVAYDSDGPGVRGGKALAANIYLKHSVDSVRVVNYDAFRAAVAGLAGAASGADLEDAIRAGLTKDDFVKICQNTPLFDPAAIPALPEVAKQEQNSDPVPVLSAELASLAPIARKLWGVRKLPEFARLAELTSIAINDRDYVFEILGAQYDSDKVEDTVKALNNIVLNTLTMHGVRHFARQVVSSAAIVREPNQGIGAGTLYWIWNGVHFVRMDDDMRANATQEVLDNVGYMADTVNRANTIRNFAGKELQAALATRPEGMISRTIVTDHLNLADGVLRLDDLALLPHSPNFHFRAVNKNVEWAKSDGDPTEWQALVDSALGANQAREMWKFIYLCLAVFPRPQIAAFFYGQGGASKGLMAEAIKWLVGEDECSAIHFDELEKPHASAGMVAKRVNISEELKNSGFIDSAKFKSITGGSQVAVDPKYRDTFSYVFQAQQIIPTNSLPRMGDWSDAFERRLCIFHFAQFKRSEQDPHYFERRLKPQLARALRYALTYGRDAWFADGERMRTTDDGAQLIDAVQSEDAVAGFWLERIQEAIDAPGVTTMGRPDWLKCWEVVGKHYVIYPGGIYSDFVAWCISYGMKAPAVHGFSKRTFDFWTTHIKRKVMDPEFYRLTNGVKFRMGAKTVSGIRLDPEKNEVDDLARVPI